MHLETKCSTVCGSPSMNRLTEPWAPIRADLEKNRTEQNRLHGLQPARLIALSTLGVPLNMRVSLSIENVHAPGDEVQHRVCVVALHEPSHRTLGTDQC